MGGKGILVCPTENGRDELTQMGTGMGVHGDLNPPHSGLCAHGNRVLEPTPRPSPRQRDSTAFHSHPMPQRTPEPEGHGDPKPTPRIPSPPCGALTAHPGATRNHRTERGAPLTAAPRDGGKVTTHPKGLCLPRGTTQPLRSSAHPAGRSSR